MSLSSRFARIVPSSVRGKALCALGALGAVLICCGTPGQQPAPEPPSVQLSAGIHLIHAELADDDYTRTRGLMFRSSLAPNHGMLFVFDRAETHCMWMRNTLIALSVAFLEDDGTVVNIEEMQPQTDQRHCARRPVRYALEMSGRWFSQHGVLAGSRLQGLGAQR